MVEVNRGTEARLNYRVTPQRRSLKGILLLFIVPYTAGARDSENYLNPDITKVNVTINSSPDRVYNEGITGIDMWNEVSRFFGTKSKKSGGGHDRPNMNLTKYLTDNASLSISDQWLTQVCTAVARALSTQRTVYTLLLKETPPAREKRNAISSP